MHLINYTSALHQTTAPTAAQLNLSSSSSSLSSSVSLPVSPASGWLAECHTEDALHQQQPQQMYVNLSTFWYCFLALITAVGLLISLISNMVIIYLFTSTPSLRKNPSNIIAVNLSLSDLLYCVQWPSVIYCSLTQSTWILEYDFVCQSFGFITVSTALASILTVLAMSIERAIVIRYSIHARNKITIRLAWLIIVLIWIVSLSSCLPPLFGKFNRYTLDPSKTSCTLDYLSSKLNHKLYILILYIAYWILPTLLISISYIIIIVTFKRSSVDLKKISGSCSSGTSTSRLHHGLQNSFKLKGCTSNPEHTNSYHNKLLDPLRDRRVSASVLDLSNCLFASSDSKHHGERETDLSTTTIHDKRKFFKRVVSSSALPGRVNLQLHTDAAVNNNDNLHRMETNQLYEMDQFSLREAKLRANQNFVSFRPRIIKTFSSIKSLPQKAANSQLTRTVLQFRLAKMSFYLILLWLVSWTPIASLAMMNSVMRCRRASATAVFLASTMTKLGPALDVFIYGIAHPKIKSRFKQIIGRLILLDDACATINSKSRQLD